MIFPITTSLASRFIVRNGMTSRRSAGLNTNHMTKQAKFYGENVNWNVIWISNSSVFRKNNFGKPRFNTPT